MQPHQQRVVDEKSELDEKIGKLEKFFDGPVFGALEGVEQRRLSAQFGYMKAYSCVLAERISAFPL